MLGGIVGLGDPGIPSVWFAVSASSPRRNREREAERSLRTEKRRGQRAIESVSGRRIKILKPRTWTVHIQRLALSLAAARWICGSRGIENCCSYNMTDGWRTLTPSDTLFGSCDAQNMLVHVDGGCFHGHISLERGLHCHTRPHIPFDWPSDMPPTPSVYGSLI